MCMCVCARVCSVQLIENTARLENQVPKMHSDDRQNKLTIMRNVCRQFKKTILSIIPKVKLIKG